MRAMRAYLAVGIAVLITACHSAGSHVPPKEPTTATTPAPAATPVASVPTAPSTERLADDTPRTTTEGSRFIAPAGWTITVKGAATILSPPEDGNWIALVDVHAADADAAVKLAWSAYKPEASWPLKVTNTAPDREGWTKIHSYDYQVSPNERRDVAADARSSGGDSWTVIIYDMQQAVGEKRGSQVGTLFQHLQPKGFERESFAGKTAHELDAARIAKLGQFVETGQALLGVPAVSIGLIQNGKVVFAGGFGVKELGGKTGKPDGNTLYMIASNTKALTTLLLAKLVDQKKLDWDTPVTTLLPSFKLGSADTTGRVLVKHLICACTGMPRQDLEWLFEFKGMTPQAALAQLGNIEPTSKFGELFQYSNSMAAAAGFVAGHVAFPKLELGAAYDRAMQTQVFGPLGMKATTFDYVRALRQNHAGAYGFDIDGKTAKAAFEVDYAIVPLRPAGAAWSSVNDMLKYVQMEIDEGTVGGKPYVSKEALLARRAPQIAIGKDATYGMGLMVDNTWGIPVVHHGGDLIGYHSDMIWIPEQKVGAVILTNGDLGGIIRGAFRRKLLEVLFDGKPEADENVASAAKTFKEQLVAERKLLTVPPEPEAAGKLARRYASDGLGEVAVQRQGGRLTFDLGEWKSDMASRKNPDGTISFVTLRPGLLGFEFVAGTAGDKRTLTVRDGQHDYVFTEKK